MSDIRESNWIAIDTIGSSYEEQIDVNASINASADAKFRHRPIAHTGETIPDWKPGPAPRP